MQAMKLTYNNRNKSSIQGVTRERKGERLLELPLPALVSGEDAHGRKFNEKIELLAISSDLAKFKLRAPVGIETSLKLQLNIPATPLLFHPLYLEVSGHVSRIEIENHKYRHQVISLELERKFQLRTVNQAVYS